MSGGSSRSIPCVVCLPRRNDVAAFRVFRVVVKVVPVEYNVWLLPVLPDCVLPSCFAFSWCLVTVRKVTGLVRGDSLLSFHGLTPQHFAVRLPCQLTSSMPIDFFHFGCSFLSTLCLFFPIPRRGPWKVFCILQVSDFPNVGFNLRSVPVASVALNVRR